MLPIRKLFFPAIFLPLIFGAVGISACRHHADVTGVNVEYVELNGKSDQHDSATDAIIAQYKNSLDAQMNEVIGHSDAAMLKEKDKLEYFLGDFTADATFDRGNTVYYPGDGKKADICLLNNGGLRSSLPAGDITRRNVYELMPFDNEIVVVTITGKNMWELVKFIGARGGEPVSGIKIGLKPDKTPQTVLIQGQPFDSTRTYKVMTSDYLANGGDQMTFLSNPVKLEATGYKIRDALLDYFSQLKLNNETLHPKLDGRIYYETK